MGLALEYCVKETALDAIKYGFKIFIFKDAVRFVDKKKSDLVIAELKNAGVVFIEVSDLK